MIASLLRKKTAAAYVAILGRQAAPMASRLGPAGGITSDGERRVNVTRATVAIYESDVSISRQVRAVRDV
jgi:hypothetical protein